MNIGLPRALLYYKYGEAWKIFLESLGQEVTVSPPTNKKIMKMGVEIADNEICTPVKIFYGHVAYLKDKVDALFIPRMVSVEKKAYTCPKFLGMPDMIRALDGMPAIIDPTVNLKLGRKAYYNSIFELGSRFTNNKFDILKAYGKAISKQRQIEKNHIAKQMPKSREVKQLRIGLAGHPYNLSDDYMSMHLVKRLRDKGVGLVTAEMTARSDIERAARVLPKRLFWSYEKEVIGAATHWIKDKLVDGVIYVIAFPCGPDSLVEVLLSGISKQFGNVPMLSLVLDEHSGEAGLITRIEAFIDQLSERKEISLV